MFLLTCPSLICDINHSVMQAKGLFSQTFKSWRQLAEKEQLGGTSGLMVLLFIPK